jgi:hypothetical protein
VFPETVSLVSVNVDPLGALMPPPQAFSPQVQLFEMVLLVMVMEPLSAF